MAGVDTLVLNSFAAGSKPTSRSNLPVGWGDLEMTGAPSLVPTEQATGWREGGRVESGTIPQFLNSLHLLPDEPSFCICVHILCVCVLVCELTSLS